MRQDFFTRINLLRRRTGIQWGGGEIIVAAILVIGILGMGSGMFGRWMRSTRGGGLLMVDLHPFSAANYGVDELPVSIPAIGLDILQDLMGMNQPPDTGGPASIARITPLIPSPTPTQPAIATGGSTPRPDSTQPDESSPTSVPTHTPTPDLVRSPTPTSTRLPPTSTKLPPTATSTAIPPTQTSEPPANPTPVAPTNTPLPYPTPIPATKTPTPSPILPTSTPLPSPTEPPAATPTAQATRPLVVTPTAQFTPVVSPGPPILP